MSFLGNKYICKEINNIVKKCRLKSNDSNHIIKCFDCYCNFIDISSSKKLFENADVVNTKNIADLTYSDSEDEKL